MTFQVHIQTGPRVGDEFANSFVELWIAREGQPSELAISWGPYNLSAGSPGENQKFGKVWLLPYNTGKDPAASYTDDVVWDSNGQQACLIGADHLAPQGPQFVSYTAANNTWQRLPRPSWLSSLVFFHGYDHSAIDQARGILYHRPFGQNLVHRYDIASRSWTQLPPPSFVNTYENCCDALEVFPDLDGLVWVRGAVGEVWLFKESTQQWSQLGTWPTQDGGTWTFAEYNPVHMLLVFGSGNSNTLFKLSSSGQITQLRNPPISIYDGSGYVGVFTVDPVSGTYLVLRPTSRQLYTYDVTTDTWQPQSSPTKPDMNSEGVVATPVSSHGVNLFVSCTKGDCHAYVYKHSVGDTPPP